jgi:dTDP-4-dehydrorhamnose 3,5-epimerase
MKLLATPIAGLVEVVTEPSVDARGSFTRISCVDELAALAPGDEAGLRFVQVNLSRSQQRGTLRGLHVQRGANAATRRREAKLIRCLRGAVWDVAVDLRPGSPTFGRWHAIELHEHCQRQVFIPPGVAHGFQTLADDSELLYQHTAAYAPGLDAGVRYDDPQLAVAWPLPPQRVSARDLALPWLDPFLAAFAASRSHST